MKVSEGIFKLFHESHCKDVKGIIKFKKIRRLQFIIPIDLYSILQDFIPWALFKHARTRPQQPRLSRTGGGSNSVSVLKAIYLFGTGGPECVCGTETQQTLVWTDII